MSFDVLMLFTSLSDMNNTKNELFMLANVNGFKV